MPRRYERGNHQLALDWFRMNALLRDCDLNQITCLDPEPFCENRTHKRGVVPSQLGDWVGQFLEPAVVSVAAVVHRITADKHDLRRIRGWNWRERPGFLRKRACRVCIKRWRLIAELNVGPKSIAQKARPGCLKIPRWIRRAKSFLHQLGSFRFRPTEQRIEQFDFGETAEKRQNHWLDRQVGAIGRERVAPGFEIMRSRNVPVA